MQHVIVTVSGDDTGVLNTEYGEVHGDDVRGRGGDVPLTVTVGWVGEGEAGGGEPPFTGRQVTPTVLT